MTSEVEPGLSQETTLNKWLRFTHLIVAVIVLVVAIQSYLTSNSEFAIAYLLTAAGLMLTSFGALHLSKAGQKIVIVASLVVAGAGAYSFVQAAKSAAEAGPAIHSVVIDFRANQYDVLPINKSACAPKGDGNPLHYTCDVKVLPLPPAPANQVEPKL